MHPYHGQVAYLTLLDKLLLYNLLFLCLIVIEVVVTVSLIDDEAQEHCYTGAGRARTDLDAIFSGSIAGTWVRRVLGRCHAATVR